MSVSAETDLAGLQPIYFNPDALDRGFSIVQDDLLQNPQIDEVTLAAAIMWPGNNPLTGNYTYYKNLRRLQNGETAIISNGELSIHSSYPAEDYNLTFEEVAAATGNALQRLPWRQRHDVYHWILSWVWCNTARSMRPGILAMRESTPSFTISPYCGSS